MTSTFKLFIVHLSKKQTMKKLGKLTLNEMQDLTPLTPQEQMGIKGGSTIWPVIRLIPWAWEVAGIISEHLWGSQESQPATGIVNPSPKIGRASCRERV